MSSYAIKCSEWSTVRLVTEFSIVATLVRKMPSSKDQAEKHLKAAARALKMSIRELRFKPDLNEAATEYQAAAQCFADAGDHSRATDALREVAEVSQPYIWKHIILRNTIILTQAIDQIKCSHCETTWIVYLGLLCRFDGKSTTGLEPDGHSRMLLPHANLCVILRQHAKH